MSSMVNTESRVFIEGELDWRTAGQRKLHMAK